MLRKVTGALLIVVPILIAPVVMYTALRAQRRLGSEAAGWIAAIPTTVPIAVLAVGLQTGDQSASTLTLSAASHVPAQICFAICFAAGMRRYGIAPGFALGAAAFVGVSLVIAFVPVSVSIAAAVVALAIGPRLLTSPVAPELVEHEQSGPTGWGLWLIRRDRLRPVVEV
jgi:hypothetical protein